MKLINWKDFLSVELRIGKIVEVQAFPEAIQPAYKLKIDFGAELGIKKSSAQITDLYTMEDLKDRLIIAVVNFPPKQIGPFISDCLVTGFHNKDGHVVLAVPDKSLPLGSKLM